MKFLSCIMILSLLFFLVLIGSLTAQTTWNYYADNPVFEAGPTESWDDSGVDWSFVIYDDNQFIMYYSGYSGNVAGIGRATSPDGITWTRDENNPVLTVGTDGEWDDDWIYPGPVKRDSSGYKMWYTGDDNLHRRIGYATSQDGISWEKYEGNPVFDIGPSGEWDDVIVRCNCVIYEDSLYKMWYKGNRSRDLFGDFNSRIGYATSPDGITWTKYEENPVFDIGEAGTWDDDNIFHCSIRSNDEGYQMWYMAIGQASGMRTGYATSSNGIEWDRFIDNPISPTNINIVTVLHHEDLYRMWYGPGDGTTILYAEDFSHIAHADSLYLSHTYMRPTLDTLNITAQVVNPNNNPLTVMGQIFVDDSSLVDSTSLSHESEGLWQGNWAVPEGEKNYDVRIKTIDEETGIIHHSMMWEIEEVFTTIGPLRIAGYEVTSADTIPNHGDRLNYKFTLINDGKTTSAKDVTTTLVEIDPCAIKSGFDDRPYGDIEAGATAVHSGGHSIIFGDTLDGCSNPMNTKILVEISSERNVFWCDTLEFIVSNIGIQNISVMPLSYKLYQNFPNPFNPVTKINYELPVSTHVRLSIYNLMGQEVETLVSKKLNAGFHQVEWDASGFASGIYYYQIQVPYRYNYLS